MNDVSDTWYISGILPKIEPPDPRESRRHQWDSLRRTFLLKRKRSDNTQITFQIKSPINKRFRFIFVNSSLNLIQIQSKFKRLFSSSATYVHLNDLRNRHRTPNWLVQTLYRESVSKLEVLTYKLIEQVYFVAKQTKKSTVLESSMLHFISQEVSPRRRVLGEPRNKNFILRPMSVDSVRQPTKLGRLRWSDANNFSIRFNSTRFDNFASNFGSRNSEPLRLKVYYHRVESIDSSNARPGDSSKWTEVWAPSA